MTQQPYRFDDWLVHNWPRVALPTGVILIVFTPLVYKAGGTVGVLAYLLLAFYMLHQYEEHAAGRFKAFVNKLLAHGEPKITDLAIFWVNILFVWVVYPAVILGTVLVAFPLVLIAAYTTLVNALLHIASGLFLRRYDPGLLTSIILFLPTGLYTIYAVGQLPETTAGYHVLGIAIALIIHILTFGYLGALARR